MAKRISGYDDEGGAQYEWYDEGDSQGRPLYGTAGPDAWTKRNQIFKGNDEDGNPIYQMPEGLQRPDRMQVGYADPGELHSGTFFPQAGFTPDMLQYDPEYGYTVPTSVWDRQQQMATNYLGQRNGNDPFTNMPLAMAAIAGGAMAGGAFGGFGEAGVNAGGLDGALGDSFLNQSWMNGAQNLGNFSESFSLPGSNSPFSLNKGTGMWDDLMNFSGDFNSGGIDFANSPSQLQNPFASVNPTEGFTTGINDKFTGLASSLSSPSYTGAMTGSALPGQAVGGDFFSQIKNFLSTPQIPGLPNSTGANGAQALLGYLMKQQQADALKSAGASAANRNDALLQPQRFPFQQAYLNLMTNPNSYYQTPYAQGQQNLANQAFQANVSKFGPSGTGFDQYLKNFQNIQSNDFFKLADQLSGAGGFNQTPGGGGQFTFLGNQGAANAGLGAFEGFGRIFDPTEQKKGYSPEQNPASGVTKIFS